MRAPRLHAKLLDMVLFGTWARVAVLALAFTPACGGGSSSPADTASTQGGASSLSSADASDEASIGCQNDPRAIAYAPNLTAAGSAGKLTFVLAAANPGPPAVGGGNQWTVRLMDTSGKPIVGATFPTIKLWMPAHGHGSTVGDVIDNGDGSYTVQNLYFFMPGLWQVTFNASVPAASNPSRSAVTDSAVFSFCIDG